MSKKPVKKVLFYPKLRTKNFSADLLKDRTVGLASHSMRSLVRLGSTTETETVFPKIFGRRPIIEINSVESIQNSRSKIKMKEAFDRAEISHAKWEIASKSTDFSKIEYPIILKRIFGFKGKGMYMIPSHGDLKDLLPKIRLDGYLIEHFHNYNREYRIHCSKNGCFYTCRKMLKRDAEVRWMRNDSNCIWILEENPLFNKPSNWDTIINDCKKALDEIELDIGAFDIKVQSAKDNKGNMRESPSYIIIEVNSAPAFGDITTEKYKKELSRLINDKIIEKNDK